ncbi:4-hydroxy-tetrahydrodipicolinate synthase [Papillibacter cinnamivorans]|uniref:4-hydroxy-tetrahydrodipicolinate synthase n=1 Tax=Papillibacter cinnamivorans DSM 12816 TaxID=1122930 RepID=A0A1W2CIM1_9FIRM|nr:4-hydroxy-tetrahydrodipicolinate synthase [Papillibacter cinnamivorans]SMC84478.1 4-hydroxy-tetrahydrodipicolinate synthase [Papillibacter cinnamivorans DSM 12816]
MKTPVFEGSSVAIITPFRGEGVDYSKLAELIDFQINGGTDSIVICGTTGEASTQSIEEHLEVIKFCVEHTNHRVKVIAGTGSNDTKAAVYLSQHAEASGADALLMVTPYYNKTTQAGLVRHFTYIADRVNIPIILYNVPSRTGLSFTADTYRELSKHPLINGVKEASGNFSLAAHTRLLCGDELNIWSGNDDQVVPLMSLGAKGVISVVANMLPADMAQMTHLCLEGKFAEASAMQIRMMDLIDALFVEVNPIPIKAAMNLMGMDVGEVRLPLCEMTAKNLPVLVNAMKNYGVKF